MFNSTIDNICLTLLLILFVCYDIDEWVITETLELISLDCYKSDEFHWECLEWTVFLSRKGILGVQIWHEILAKYHVRKIMQFQLYFFIEVQITSTTKVYGYSIISTIYSYTKVHYMLMYEYNTMHYICSPCKITCTRKLFSNMFQFINSYGIKLSCL